MTLNDFYDAPHMELVSEEVRAQVANDLYVYQTRIEIKIDGETLRLDVKPENRNGRTMVPIRLVAEALGAVVDWDGSTGTVIMTRAGHEVTMTIGSYTATVDGKTVQMDVAPYISGDRTLVPARFVAEFFGQKVDWDEENRTVIIEEDKSVAGESNLEAWALPMGAMLSDLNRGTPTRFGLYSRCNQVVVPSSSGIAPPGGGNYSMVYPYALARDTLRNSWGITGREDLIWTVCSMTAAGHNEDFLETAEYINSLTYTQYYQFTNANEVNAYMAPYTKQLSQKWGDRGILCWDLFRMSNLVQWGYNAGYVTYAEALALLEPAATLLCENFSSWEDAYENYLDGYNWWARNNVLGQDIWETDRGEAYQMMKNSNYGPELFDDTLFEAGVIPVPGVTAEELLQSVLESWMG